MLDAGALSCPTVLLFVARLGEITIAFLLIFAPRITLGQGDAPAGAHGVGNARGTCGTCARATRARRRLGAGRW